MIEVCLVHGESDRRIDRGERRAPDADTARWDARERRRRPRAEEISRTNLGMLGPLMASRHDEIVETLARDGAPRRPDRQRDLSRVPDGIDDAATRADFDLVASGAGTDDQRFELVLEERAERQSRIEGALVDLIGVDPKLFETSRRLTLEPRNESLFER